MVNDTGRESGASAAACTVGGVPLSTLPRDLIADALDLYDPALPYHNANHALHVAHLASRFSRRAAGSAVPHDPEVVVVAALLHDAGYGHHQGAVDAEAHSATLAFELLHDHGWPPGRVDAVCDAIEATRLHAGSITVEGLIVRAADLWEMGAPWPVFAANRTLLRLEAEMLDGVTFNADAWRLRVSRIVVGYALGPMWLAPCDDVETDDVACWRERVQANLALHAQR